MFWYRIPQDNSDKFVASLGVSCQGTQDWHLPKKSAWPRAGRGGARAVAVGGGGAGGGVGIHCVLCDFSRFCFGCPKRGGHPFFSGVGGGRGAVLDALWKVSELTLF